MFQRKSIIECYFMQIQAKFQTLLFIYLRQFMFLQITVLNNASIDRWYVSHNLDVWKANFITRESLSMI